MTRKSETEAMEEDPGNLVSQVLANQVRMSKSVAKTLLSKSSGDRAVLFSEAVIRGIEQGLERLDRDFPPAQPGAAEAGVESFKTPSPPRRKRKRHEELAGNREDGNTFTRQRTMTGLRGCVILLQAGLSHCRSSFRPARFFPVVRSLHDKLVVLEDDAELQDAISEICELWWREGFDGKEALIAQSLPFLLSRSLTSNRKIDVHRVYAIREAFLLFDFYDVSIEDLKHLLIRTVVTPSFLRSAEGRRFIAFLFGLNPQLVKELNALMHSQIPFGRKSILEAYGEVLYRAWKGAVGEILVEVENSCLQVLIEGAIYASSKTLSSACRKVLEGFTSQRAEAGVEGMLFRLQEPLLFRSLQVANSNVRRNAILLMVDLFPLQHPDASMEEKEALFEKQFSLIEKLLQDPCPDVRSVTVEGACRVLRLFWEVIPSVNAAKLLTKIADDMSNDQSSSSSRLAVVEGVTYLLENPQSHEILKILLPRLSHMLNDSAVTVRTAAVELLLAVKNIRSIPFHKVARLDTLLSILADDCDAVARRLTKLLIPSYFPTKSHLAEACNRCCTLIKRSASAGARFCSYIFTEGVPAESSIELLKFLCSLALPESDLDQEHRQGVLLAISELGLSLAKSGHWKHTVGNYLTGHLIVSLLKVAATSETRCSIVKLASSLPAKNVPELVKYCGEIVMTSANHPTILESSHEIRTVNSFVLSWGSFEDLVDTLLTTITAFCDNISSVQKFSSSKKSAKAKNCRGKTRSSPRQKSFETLFNSAIGAAWHVQNLLAESDTRRALLSYGRLQDLLSRLRQVAEYCMQNVEKISPQGPVSSVITAYANLTIHLRLERKRDGSMRTSTGRRKRHRVDVSIATPVSNPSQDCFEDVLGDLIDWSLKMTQDLRVLRGNFFVQHHSLKLASATLRSVLEALNLGLSSSGTLHAKSMSLASAIFTTIQERVKAEGVQENVQEILPCLKATASYAGKLLSVCMKDRNSQSPDAFKLAQDVLNSLSVIEQNNAGSWLSLLPALRHWLPDLIGAVTQKILTEASSPEETSQSWLKHVAAVSFESREENREAANSLPVENEERTLEKQAGGVDLLQALVKTLRRASQELMQAFVRVLIHYATLCFEASDYDAAIGLVHLSCRRLLRSKENLNIRLEETTLTDLKKLDTKLSALAIADDSLLPTKSLVKEILAPHETDEQQS